MPKLESREKTTAVDGVLFKVSVNRYVDSDTEEDELYVSVVAEEMVQPKRRVFFNGIARTPSKVD